MAGTRERQLSLRWLMHIQIVAIVELCGRNEIRKAFYSFPLKARFVSHRVASSLGGEMKPKGPITCVEIKLHITDILCNTNAPLIIRFRKN